MPTNQPAKPSHSIPSAANAAGMNRMVLGQMLACGILGWGIFAIAVDRWLPVEQSSETLPLKTNAQQVAGPINGTTIIKSAQFHVSERDKTR